MILPRSFWGAQHGRGARMSAPASHVILHHDGGLGPQPDEGWQAEIEYLRRIDKMHFENPKIGTGIAYGFEFFLSGERYEGRGWGHRGAHARHMNPFSYGFLLALDGFRQRPTPKMIAAVKATIIEGIKLNFLVPDPIIDPHSDHVPTKCPGPLVLDVLDEIRDLWPKPTERMYRKPRTRRQSNA